MNSEVTIYVDGACQPNPGSGGWAALLMCNGVERLISGQEPDTTNQRMEIRAAIEALKVLKWPCNVTLYSDSQYLIQTMLGNWKSKSNGDLWGELFSVHVDHIVEYVWLKGHAGHPGNERVDVEAERQARLCSMKVQS